MMTSITGYWLTRDQPRMKPTSRQNDGALGRRVVCRSPDVLSNGTCPLRRIRGPRAAGQKRTAPLQEGGPRLGHGRAQPGGRSLEARLLDLASALFDRCQQLAAAGKARLPVVHRHDRVDASERDHG
jgi:hypothetical protein